MITTKRHTQRDQSPPKQLFADYPYPILNELSKTSKQEEPSDHTHTLISVEWYRECFYKMSGMLHGLHRRNSPTSIIEQSFRQAHIDVSSSSAAIVNNLQKNTKPTRIKRILASSTTPLMNDQQGQTNESRVRRINLARLRHHIDDDQG